MAYVYFDSSYAPAGFLIVRDGGNPRKESDSILIQVDYDYPGVAARMGWDIASVGNELCPHISVKKDSEGAECLSCGQYDEDISLEKALANRRIRSCNHRGTDGTIPCPDCNLTASDFIAAALTYIQEHAEKSYPQLDEYFEEG